MCILLLERLSYFKSFFAILFLRTTNTLLVPQALRLGAYLKQSFHRAQAFFLHVLSHPLAVCFRSVSGFGLSALDTDADLILGYPRAHSERQRTFQISLRFVNWLNQETKSLSSASLQVVSHAGQPSSSCERI